MRLDSSTYVRTILRYIPESIYEVTFIFRLSRELRPLFWRNSATLYRKGFTTGKWRAVQTDRRSALCSCHVTPRTKSERPRIRTAVAQCRAAGYRAPTSFLTFTSRKPTTTSQYRNRRVKASTCNGKCNRFHSRCLRIECQRDKDLYITGHHPENDSHQPIRSRDSSAPIFRSPTTRIWGIVRRLLPRLYTVRSAMPQTRATSIPSNRSRLRKGRGSSMSSHPRIAG
jgi:hypothetical protein